MKTVSMAGMLKKIFPINGKRSPEVQAQVDSAHARRANERRQLLSLTADEIGEIQRAFDAGEFTWRELADRYGVCFTDIDHITNDSLHGALAYCKREGSR